jgi:hypothetical protein
MKLFEKTKRGSLATSVLEKVWRSLQQKHKGLPSVVVVLYTVDNFSNRGHFAPACWSARGRYNRSELAISPKLFHKPELVLATLLHEAAHALLWKRKIRSIGSGNYYHLKAFRDMCTEELYLICKFRNTRYGFTDTYLKKDALIHYKKELTVLYKLPSGSGKFRGPKSKGNKLPKPGHLIAYCNCGRTIRSTPLNFHQGEILCGICKSLFKLKLKQK